MDDEAWENIERTVDIRRKKALPEKDLTTKHRDKIKSKTELFDSMSCAQVAEEVIRTIKEAEDARKRSPNIKGDLSSIIVSHYTAMAALQHLTIIAEETGNVAYHREKLLSLRLENEKLREENEQFKAAKKSPVKKIQREMRRLPSTTADSEGLTEGSIRVEQIESEGAGIPATTQEPLPQSMPGTMGMTKERQNVLREELKNRRVAGSGKAPSSQNLRKDVLMASTLSNWEDSAHSGERPSADEWTETRKKKKTKKRLTSRAEDKEAQTEGNLKAGTYEGGRKHGKQKK